MQHEQWLFGGERYTDPVLKAINEFMEMTMVSLSDFIILDCWLPLKAKPYVKGTENCKAWERREWLKTLAIPEHGLLWTLIVCPIAGLAVAGLNMLF